MNKNIKKFVTKKVPYDPAKSPPYLPINFIGSPVKIANDKLADDDDCSDIPADSAKDREDWHSEETDYELTDDDDCSDIPTDSAKGREDWHSEETDYELTDDDDCSDIPADSAKDWEDWHSEETDYELTDDDDCSDIPTDSAKDREDWHSEETDYELTDDDDCSDILTDSAKDREDWHDEKENKTNNILEKKQMGTFPKERTRNNEYTDIGESPYLVAQEFCKKYKLKHFFPEEADNDIWLFKKNAGYDYIDEEKLSTLIYDMLPNELKLRIKNIASYIKNVIEFIYKEMAINPVNASLNVGKCFSPKDFEKIKYHALFQNGVYDLRSNKLYPHFNAGYPYYLPIQAEYIRKPNDYLLHHAKNFQKLLWDTTDGDKDTMEMIMVYLPYFMIPYKNREIVFITGPTASGKSIFADLINALMPPGRVSSMNITDFGGRFSLGNASKYLLINGRDVEINSGGTAALKPKDISVLKQCSGDSIITTEAKGKMPHVTHIIFKLLFASNGPVVPAHPDSAYEDRVTLLPFMQSVPKEQRDPELGQKVLAEKDYIITLCMRKLKKCIDERGNIILPVSKQAQKLKSTWFQYTDFIEKFIENKIHFTGNKEDFVKNKEIFEEYKKYYLIERTDTVRSSIAKQEDVLEKILCVGMGQAKPYRKDNKRGILGILLK